ncbi:hypothetical protein R3P38DRAFT_3212842 [Favolaschia claudopus]|uniref:Uncharacterized protein n=1 Tax=Favolaschia claudopus TaxID=2862362 RepID=A0AAW0ADA1_9AGAR
MPVEGPDIEISWVMTFAEATLARSRRAFRRDLGRRPTSKDESIFKNNSSYVSLRIQHMAAPTNDTFPLDWESRQSCTAGYYTPPLVYSKMKFELRRIPFVNSRVVKDGQCRRWELWSPNSTQTPFLPGWRAPGLLPSIPTKPGDRRYDGHVGKMDCLFSPHYSGENIAHWPYLRRPYLVKPDDFAYAAYEPLMNQWDVNLADRRMGSFRLEFVQRLSSLRQDLDQRIAAVGARLHTGSKTWDIRPQFASATAITELLGVRTWVEAVDRGVGVQRGLREKEAWLSMTHARRILGRTTLEQLRGVHFPKADERFLGVWVNGLPESTVLANMYAGLPCFIVHSYASEDLTRADAYPATSTRSDFVTGTDVITAVLESPYQKLARQDAYRLDASFSPSQDLIPQISAAPEEEKLSSSLYLEQLGIDGAREARCKPRPSGTSHLRSTHTTASKPPSGESSAKQDRFAHRELERQVIHPDRVAWIVPPAVAVANPKGKWAKYELTELESGRTAFVYRGKTAQPQVDEKFFDREKKRRLYMGSYDVPPGVVNKGVFGVPVPPFPFIVIDGIKEKMDLPSYWMYRKEEPEKGDEKKVAEVPTAEELPFLPGREPRPEYSGKGKGRATAEQEAELWARDAARGMEVPEQRPEKKATNVLVISGFSEDIRAATFESMTRDAFYHARSKPLSIVNAEGRMWVRLATTTEAQKAFGTVYAVASNLRLEYGSHEHFAMVLSRATDVWNAPEAETAAPRGPVTVPPPTEPMVGPSHAPSLLRTSWIPTKIRLPNTVLLVVHFRTTGLYPRPPLLARALDRPPAHMKLHALAPGTARILVPGRVPVLATIPVHVPTPVAILAPVLRRVIALALGLVVVPAPDLPVVRLRPPALTLVAHRHLPHLQNLEVALGLRQPAPSTAVAPPNAPSAPRAMRTPSLFSRLRSTYPPPLLQRMPGPPLAGRMSSHLLLFFSACSLPQTPYFKE